MTSIEKILTALEALDCRPRGNYERGWTALCPAHDDRSPSLSIIPHSDKTGLYCHAGCDTEVVLGVLGLGWSDLFEEVRSCQP